MVTVDPTTLQRFRGTLCALEGDAEREPTAALLHFARLRIGGGGGGATLRRREVPAFRLRLADGSTLRVETVAETILAPESRTRAAWSALATTAAGRDFADDAPGPHVRCELTHARLTAGDEVEVLGAVLEEGFDEQAAAALPGLRTAPVARPRVIRARIVAGGATPSRTLDRAYARAYPSVRRKITLPSPGSIWRTHGPRIFLAALVLAAVASVYATFEFAADPSSKPPHVVAMFAVAFAGFFLGLIVFGYLSPPRIAFRAGTSDKAAPPDRTLRPVGLATFAAIVGLLAVPTSMAGWPPFLIGWTGLTFVGLAFARWTLWREQARRARALLAAPRATGVPAEGSWCAIEGTVRDPSPARLRGREVAMGVEGTVEFRDGSDPDLVRAHTVAEGSFLVYTDAAIFEVQPSEALWASAANRHEIDAQGRHVFEEFVPDRGQILVAGTVRPRAEGTPIGLRVAGAESLLAFASEAEGPSPRARLSRALWGHRAALALLLAGAVATMALQYWVGYEIEVSLEE